MTIEEHVENELRTLALTNWEQFKERIHLDMTTLLVCERKRRDKSIRQIAAAMQMPKSTVEKHCNKCP